MAALNAHVKNGRLVLDEPTTLPEGAEVRLWVVEGDDLDDEDRAALHDAIREGIEDAKARRTIDADEWIIEVKGRKRGFCSLYDFLAESKAVVHRADHREWFRARWPQCC